LEVGPVFTVSMDGRRVAYSTLLWYSNLWLARSRGPNIHSQPDTDFQTKALTTGARMLRFPSISPDGRWVAYASREHIYKMPIEGGTPIQLTFSDAEVASTPAWSPDGKRIAFGSDEGGAWKVWIVGADGADRRRFANTQLGGSRSEAVGDLKWSPGRLILYQRPGNRNFNTLDPETAEEKPLVQNESGSIFSPEYSPDGKNVALHWNRRPQGGLWIVSPAGHSETFLGDSGDLSPVGWSPDGSSIYAWDGAKNVMSIPVAPTRRGAPRPVFSVPGGLNIPFMTMSADGKEFVYCIQESRSDVWVVDNFDPANRK
jgi:Tol biopolymer transport system component